MGEKFENHAIKWYFPLRNFDFCDTHMDTHTHIFLYFGTGNTDAHLVIH